MGKPGFEVAVLSVAPAPPPDPRETVNVQAEDTVFARQSKLHVLSEQGSSKQIVSLGIRSGGQGETQRFQKQEGRIQDSPGPAMQCDDGVVVQTSGQRSDRGMANEGNGFEIEFVVELECRFCFLQKRMDSAGFFRDLQRKAWRRHRGDEFEDVFPRILVSNWRSAQVSSETDLRIPVRL